MKNVRESCIQFFQNEDIKRDFKEMLRPVVGIVYNEVYPYLWMICIYNVFLIFIIMANLFLLLRLLQINHRPQILAGNQNCEI